MRRGNGDIGPQGKVQRMTAVSAGQNIGGNIDYVDNDNFYPADGMPENDREFTDLTNRRSQIDKVDMVYDNRLNDLGSGADFFDGDYQNSYANGMSDRESNIYVLNEEYNLDEEDDEGDEDENYGLGVYDTDVNDLGSDSDFFDGDGRPDYEDEDDEYDDYMESDYDNLDGEDYDYATGKRKIKKKKSSKGGLLKSAGGFAKGRLDKRDERVDSRREQRGGRKKERHEARISKKTSKSDEIKARNELTKSIANEPDTTAQIMASLQEPVSTKSSEITPKKGLSVGAIIGISVGSLAILAVAAYFIMKKKK